MKTTAVNEIMRVLGGSPVPVAVHELGIIGYSENALATRLSELQRIGRVRGQRRPGKSFKEWFLPDPKNKPENGYQPD